MTDTYEVPVPGFFIQEELDARGWSQRDLAFILGIEETALNKIINGKTGISLEMSKALGTAFEVDHDFFANLQKARDLANTASPDPAIAKRATLQGAYPVREMIRRGWLKNAPVDALEAQLMVFMRASSGNYDVRSIPHAAKKTSYDEPTTPAQLVWLYRVVQIAEAMKCKPYSETALGKVRPRLQALMDRPEGVEDIPALLAECGVRFVIVEGLPGAKIDGVCIWLDPNTPIIALSFRYDRIDNFWFVLWHEIAHVLKRHGRDESAWIVDVELEGDRASGDSTTNSVQEREANSAAADYCVNQHEMVTFAARRTFFSERDIVAFANRMRVHPGIVIGQVHRITSRYELLRRLQVKVREYIMPTAMVDGWGHIAPLPI